MTAIAVIGLRSGSKTIRNKNIVDFCGKPLMYWIIKAALNSKKIDRVFVSTDSKKYQKLAIKFGAEAPFLRPKSLSEDTSNEKEYLLHCLNWLQKNERYKPKIIVRLQATSPLQLPLDIDKCVKSLQVYKNSTSAIAASESFQPPFKAMKLDNKKKYLKPYFDGHNIEIVNRQKLDKAYYRSNIIASRCSYFLKTKNQIGPKSVLIQIPQNRSFDINNSFDLEISKFIAKKLKLCQI